MSKMHRTCENLGTTILLGIDLTCHKLKDTESIQKMRNAYLHTLVAPADGMWESVVIAHANFWEMQDRGQHVGYFCVDTDNCLLRFHLLENYHVQAQEIFHWIISTYGIQSAITSTIEPLYYSLCLDIQVSSMVHSYLFRDHQRIDLVSSLKNSLFRKAEKRELRDIVRFYHANTEGPGEWIEAFIHRRVEREELFVLSDQHVLVATGECIPGQSQRPYSDLGMVVAREYRGRGLGSFMLVQLKNYCYEANLKPICSCAADNYASKKAIERAGFISEHRIVKVAFL